MSLFLRNVVCSFLFLSLYRITFFFSFPFVFLWTGFSFDFCLNFNCSVTFLASICRFFGAISKQQQKAREN